MERTDAHRRLRRASQALITASVAYWKKKEFDPVLWDKLQRAEMAVRHALDDEERGGNPCPCQTCHEIGGVLLSNASEGGEIIEAVAVARRPDLPLAQ